jgi:hypothetical protein
MQGCTLILFLLLYFFTAGCDSQCERVEGGRAATQCDLLVMVLPGSQLLLVAEYTVVDLAHTLQSTPNIIMSL